MRPSEVAMRMALDWSRKKMRAFFTRGSAANTFSLSPVRMGSLPSGRTSSHGVSTA